MSIFVNSRSIFCLSWKNALGALATQNKRELYTCWRIRVTPCSSVGDYIPTDYTDLH